MSISELEYISEKSESELSDTDTYDSEDDPNFDILEETKSSFSKLSINKKAKPRLDFILKLFFCLFIILRTRSVGLYGLFSRYNISKEMNEETEEVQKQIVPELDKQDQKCYDIVRQIIEGYSRFVND